ncbi:hypothetical protein MMC06_003118 [Schaereria dolodes]|nr:hypothetical protein [Schaereria dolodes]
MSPIPITIITGFLGSGKTTLVLNLIPQLPANYKLALLKNEFGDLAIDSQLASSSAISGVKELLNGCICCNLVGQLGDALDTLRNDVQPDRIIVETSGSAFPATLAMEINRLGRETVNYTLDGVIVVIDVENWKGYDDTSYTARLQARYTDLVVFNKWEHVSERRYEDCLDRMGDLELQVANVKSDRGRVDLDVLLGLDSALARKMDSENGINQPEDHHDHALDHQSEVEVLSITITTTEGLNQGIDLEMLEAFLLSAPKDEIYRIKAVVASSQAPASWDGSSAEVCSDLSYNVKRYILNWAFGRWTFTLTSGLQEIKALPTPPDSLHMASQDGNSGSILRMTIIFARYEAEKWKRRIEAGGILAIEGGSEPKNLQVKRVS